MMARRLLMIGGGNRPLPSLPTATGAKIVGLGHSMIGRANFTAGSPTVSSLVSMSRGVLEWVKALDQRFNVDTFVTYSPPSWSSPALGNAYDGSNQGRDGDWLTYQNANNPGTLYRTSYLAQRRPQFCYLDIGTNDITLASVTADSLISLYDQQLQALRRAGIWVIAQAIIPRGSTGWEIGGTFDNIRLAFNTWLQAQYDAGRPGLLGVINSDVLLGTTFPNSLYYTDNIHINDQGAYLIATQQMLPILQAAVASGSFYDTDQTVSNIMPDAGMLGTAGTKGAGVTGNVATNWNVTIGAGISTVVASKEVIDASYEKQVLTITPVADATPRHQVNIQKTTVATLSSLNVVEGDWLEFLWRYELSAWDYWVSADTVIRLSQSTTDKLTHLPMREDAATSGQVLPTGGYEFWAITRVKVPAGLSIDTLRFTNQLGLVRWLGAAIGTGIIKVSKPILRKISNPATAWNLPG